MRTAHTKTRDTGIECAELELAELMLQISGCRMQMDVLNM